MKKVNFGIILFILVLISFGIYIVNNEKSKENEKKDVLEFVQDYYKIYNKYSMLDEEYRKINENIDEDKYNNYLSKMSTELSNYIFDSRQTFIFETYKSRLDNQFYGKYMMNEYNKEIMEVVYYTFDKDYISVYMKIKISVDEDRRISPTFDKNTNKYIGRIKNLKGEEYFYETVCVKRIDNKEYKVVYHSIMDIVKYAFED